MKDMFAQLTGVSQAKKGVLGEGAGDHPVAGGPAQKRNSHPVSPRVLLSAGCAINFLDKILAWHSQQALKNLRNRDIGTAALNFHRQRFL